MSEQDRQRWDLRYQQGSYSARTYPSPFLVDWHERLQPTKPLRALDLGCGAGRNALYLAKQGHRVTGYDISEVALARARQSAAQLKLSICLESMDFDRQTPARAAWDLVVMVRFMNRRLQPALADLLSPTGVLMLEHHVVTAHDATGPQPPNDDGFRLRPNELLNDCAGLHIVHYSEHRQIDADNKKVVLAQLVACAQSAQVRF